MTEGGGLAATRLCCREGATGGDMDSTLSVHCLMGLSLRAGRPDMAWGLTLRATPEGKSSTPV